MQLLFLDGLRVPLAEQLAADVLAHGAAEALLDQALRRPAFAKAGQGRIGPQLAVGILNAFGDLTLVDLDGQPLTRRADVFDADVHFESLVLVLFCHGIVPVVRSMSWVVSW